MISRKTIRNLLSDVFDVNTTANLINSFGSTIYLLMANPIETSLRSAMAALPDSLADFSGVPSGQSKDDYLKSVYKFKTVLTKVFGDASNLYFSEIVQAKAAQIHIRNLMEFISNDLATALNKTTGANAINNTDQLLSNVMDELFFDATLKRYFGWFLVPNDETRFSQMKVYLTNRLLKILSEAITKSSALSNQAHYAVLGTSFITFFNDSFVVTKTPLSGAYLK